MTPEEFRLEKGKAILQEYVSAMETVIEILSKPKDEWPLRIMTVFEFLKVQIHIIMAQPMPKEIISGCGPYSHLLKKSDCETVYFPSITIKPYWDVEMQAVYGLDEKGKRYAVNGLPEDIIEVLKNRHENTL